MEIKPKHSFALPPSNGPIRSTERSGAIELKIAEKRGEQQTGTSLITRRDDRAHPSLMSSPPGAAGSGPADLWTGRSKMQEVVPNLLISNFFGARNFKELTGNGITHVVVCAEELPEVFPTKFAYLKLNGLTDNTGTQLHKYLELALPWMKKAIDDGGRVLLHCASGSSRSGAILTAYLMWSQNLSMSEALAMAKSSRPIIEPNPGFLEQLKIADSMARI